MNSDRTFYILLGGICLAASIALVAPWMAIHQRIMRVNTETPVNTSRTPTPPPAPPRDEHWEVAYSHLGNGFTGGALRVEVDANRVVHANDLKVEWVMRFWDGPRRSTQQVQIGLLENGMVVWRKRPVDFQPYTLENK